MYFSNSIAFHFKTPFFSAFTHAQNKKGHAAKGRQTRCLVVPVEANLDS